MRHAPSRRLTAAIIAALAVTAGTLAAAPGALAATAAVSAPSAAAGEVIPFPLGSEIVSAGATGFLSSNAAGEYRWTRLADGSSTVVASQAPVLAGASDVLVTTTGDRVLRVQDMATGAAPVEIDLKALADGTHTAFGAVGATVLTSVTTPAGAVELHLVASAADGAVSNRSVTGLPAGAGSFTLASAAPGTALVGFQADGKSRFAVIDLATNAATETYESPRPSALSPFAAVSATHVAWVESQYASQDEAVVVTNRATGAVQRFTARSVRGVRIGLTGSWLVHRTYRNGQSAFDAKSLGTEPAKQLLAHATSVATAPDGTLLVRGGSLTMGEGEGLYRIAADSDGGITRQLVARTGEPTEVVLKGHNIPQVLDLDKNRGVVPFTFEVSKAASADFYLRPGDLPDCGEYWTSAWSGNGSTDGAGSLTMTWDGRFDYPHGGEFSSGTAANGTWTWCVNISPHDGAGPSVQQRGTFTVTRKPHPHDFSDNGSPDAFIVDGAGALESWDGDYSPSQGWVGWHSSTQSVSRSGWNVYDRFTIPGNLGGNAEPDVVTRDRSGGLWLHPSTGNDVQLGNRKKIGTNWGVYDKINGTADMTGDGKPDLLATDKSGNLWLYPGTGNIDAPLGDRRKIGGGWGVYNQIATTGNIAGAPAGDLVARDAAGVLWLYLGKGDGTFASRVRIGGGWNEYTRFTALGDVTRDGRGDLLVSYPDAKEYDGEGGYLYESTGDWRAPFKPRREAITPGGRGDVAVF
ncbi:FG-GAP repeat domain-containing protein [Streptomyces aureus]|uniref:FG-GAP repeat domain-containing protein n=1 Tax=Streptomyces aureus TaxID=193461 RepID=UPI0006E1ECFA|nr:VCBS repeat-containing protein [Streptomyces aureus]